MKNSFVLVSTWGKETGCGLKIFFYCLERTERSALWRGVCNTAIHGMECNDALDDIDEKLGCVCLKRSTNDQKDHLTGIQGEEARASYSRRMVRNGAFQLY